MCSASVLKREREDDSTSATDGMSLSDLPEGKRLKTQTADIILEVSDAPLSANSVTPRGPADDGLFPPPGAQSPTTSSNVAVKGVRTPQVDRPKRGGKARRVDRRVEKNTDGWPDKRQKSQRSKAEGGEPTSAPADAAAEKSTKPRLPKRKVALMIGFCGTGCQGMQINPGARTIEGLLFEALVKAGAVSEDNADDAVKVSLQRAARTDAGVHAAGNLVSLKMITQVPGVDDIVAHANTFLPPEIRIWSYVRAHNSFNARHSCDSRVYEYLFPSYLLLPPKPGSKMANQILSEPTPDSASALPVSDGTHPGNSPHPFWANVDAECTWEEDLRRKRAWRTPPEPLATIRSLVKCYEGTHNFHNYTIGREFKDRSNKRYMMSIEVRDPQVYGDMEWISVKFHGQSFMLHQIRKMISMAILACRTGSPASLILESYGPTRIRIPKAPALGLLLEEPQFGAYNTKIVAHNKQLDDLKARDKPVAEADYRDPVDFTPYHDAIQQFKVEQIYERLRAEELKTGAFDEWIRSVDTYAFDDFAYFNSKGVIPPSAVAMAPKERGKGRQAPGDGLPSGQPLDLSDSEDDVDLNAAKSEEMEG